jgi:hypothetical protein
MGKVRFEKRLAWRSVAGFFDLVGSAIGVVLDPLGKKLNDWIKQRAPEGATGDYKKGCKYRLVGRGINTRLQLYNESKYEKYVEEGRKPGGFPPIDNLIGWVARVLNVNSFGVQQRIAYAIGMNIAMYGTEGHWLYREAEKANMRAVNAALKEAEAKVMEILNG